jgi:Anti-sigma-K factor rskA
VSEPRDFRELVGDDVPAQERERLERVHELLIAAGPPPELPPHLAAPGAPHREEAAVSVLPRRRAGLMLGLAAAVALIAFLGGFIAGRARDTFPTDFTVSMHGTALASNASAVIRVGELDSSGNWPLKLVDVKGLKPLPKGEYYEMFLTRHGRRAASCGTFRYTPGESIPSLNAPYRLRSFTGWIVTIERPGAKTHPVVLTTTRT